jgi:hypothetical protein
MRRSPSRTSSDACSAPDEPAAVALVPSALRAGVPGSPPPVGLSHGLWIRRYGRDPAIVGRSLTIDGLRTTVVGVMPASFTFPDPRTDAWIAAQSTRATASSLFTFMGFPRLRDGTTLASARAETTQLMTVTSAKTRPS